MKKRIIIHLYGGVGNQLFQYVFGEYIRIKYGRDVFYDISSFGILETYRDYQLNVIRKELPIYKTNLFFFSRYNKYLRYALRLLYKHLPRIKYICDYEDQFEESILCDNSYSTIYLDGYWHRKTYAEWIKSLKSDILQPCQPTPQEITEYIDYIKERNVTSMHVRRGDYLKPENSHLAGVCSMDYYKNAILRIKDKYPNMSLLVFSDDTEWVKHNIKYDGGMLIVRNDNIQPFWYIYLMSLCNHNIISNSTFSWWGAFLNDNPDKMVVLPARWFNGQDNPDIFFESWIKI